MPVPHIRQYINDAKEVRGRRLRAAEAEKRKTLLAEIEAEFGTIKPLKTGKQNWQGYGSIVLRG